MDMCSWSCAVPLIRTELWVGHRQARLEREEGGDAFAAQEELRSS